MTKGRGKVRTGILGLDEMTAGGLPRGRVTLVEGDAGAGKTIFSLQMLMHGAREEGEPGIFVAFEETAADVLENAGSFGWELEALNGRSLHFLDAKPQADMVRSGSFDFGGLIAVLQSLVESSGAKRVVFDAIDVVLDLLGDRHAAQREIARLDDFVKANGLTAVVTMKSFAKGEGGSGLEAYRFIEYLVDCALLLSHEWVLGVSQRGLRIRKYRGSAYEENSAPLLIGAEGLEVAYWRSREEPAAPVTDERVSSGVARLDEMLGGGYFRGAGVLVTGAPGTAKTTLSGSFAAAACARGEPTLFVSFDSRSDEIVRNLGSVGIDLRSHVESGMLRLVPARSIAGSAESHLLWIKRMAQEQGTRCLIVDPLSALAKPGNQETSHSVAERLIDWGKVEGLTLLCTSLLDHATPALEGSLLQISTIADTWIHLSYLVLAGERNRGLSIVKSRGTAHSNQVRELLLSEDGVELADVYAAGGEVLMGTQRWAKERQERLEREASTAAADRQQATLAAETSALEARLEALQQELTLKRWEQRTLLAGQEEEQEELRASETDLRERRVQGPPERQGGGTHNEQ